MEKSPFFSVVIPTYNRAKLIEKTIRTVLDQTYEHFEVLVVDDGSTDHTAEVVTAIDDPRVLYLPKENGERGAARNYGAQRAKGDYINFFDSDDWLYPHHLATACDFLQQHQQPEIFHLAYDIRYPDGKVARNPHIPDDINAALIRGNVLSCNGVFVRKDIAQQYPFHEDRRLSASEDWALWLTLASRYPILSSKEITSTVVDHESRSVMTANKTQMLTRQHLLIEYLKQDPVFMEKYGKRLKYLKSSTLSYVALHLALVKGQHKDALRYLFRAWWMEPLLFTQRRFWATWKHLFLNLIK